tara:strand:- start:551 stop:1738 length:1188 start_codon:yes stop_codon:yes gene_type:complete
LQFQTLDDKKECVGIYQNGQLSFNQPLSYSLSRTWSYSAFLDDKNIEYARLYCGGKTLDEVCPEALQDRWQAVKKKLEAFLKSFSTARVSLDQNCFYDLVPEKFLLEFCYVKDMICDYVFETYDKPENYEYMLNLTKEIDRIKYQRMNINSSNLLLQKQKHRRFAKKLSSIIPYCKFNIRGTKTGRLTTLKNSFPILTLDKDLRSVIEPQNDFFIELDFNAAELRTLLSLSGKTQPDIDLHEWNIKNVFNQSISRDEAKKKIFAWLYNPESYDRMCEHAYSRDFIVSHYYSKGLVVNYFNREIESEKRTALNYIIQSTCAENVLRQMIKLSNYLKQSKSFVAFPIHDSVVIDFSIEDKDKIKEMVNIFSETELGKFLVNVSAGKNFGSLQEIKGL